MIEIIGPERFQKFPWKNGKGVTTQLAINAGGSLTEFDWRISIARVVEDGAFSNFNGYWRNLALLEGAGMWLSHDQAPAQPLLGTLNVASFDGAAATLARLVDGPIVDFNLISKSRLYRAEMHTRVDVGGLSLRAFDFGFVYAPSHELSVKIQGGSVEHPLPKGHLLKLTQADSRDLWAVGQSMIVMGLRLI